MSLHDERICGATTGYTAMGEEFVEAHLAFHFSVSLV